MNYEEKDKVNSLNFIKETHIFPELPRYIKNIKGVSAGTNRVYFQHRDSSTMLSTMNCFEPDIQMENGPLPSDLEGARNIPGKITGGVSDVLWPGTNIKGL